MTLRLLPATRGPAALLLLVLGAASSLATPAQAQTDGAPPTDLAKWSKEDVAKAEAFVRKFLDDLASESPHGALEAFDLEAMLDIVFDGIGTDEERAEMRKGARSTMGQSLLQTLTMVAQGDRKLKRLLMVDGQPCARVRFAGQQGITILDLELVRRGDGFAFRGLNNRTIGVSALEEMRNMAVIVTARKSTGLLARLLGTDSVSTTDVDNLLEMNQAFQRGEFDKAKVRHDKLSKPLQESSLVTAMHLQILANGADEDAYVKALESAVARFPAPKFRMTMLDAHFLRRRWKEAIRCIDEAMQGIERDAVLLTLRATIQLQSGDVAAARKSTAEAMALEPDCTYVLATSLDVLLAAKDWATLAATMQTLEKTGSYDFHGKLEDEVWAEFRKQPEAKPWQ
ncbi:MAG: hypothetical protein JNL12_08105 [Planctomycetes bacterium]|nr:hypothetical protein [Planctomycetota bacterium]